MNINEVNKKSLVWSYVENCMKEGGMWDELIHGGRHMRQIREEANILIENCRLNLTLSKCLRIAADTHDLGRLGADFPYPGVNPNQLTKVADAARIDSQNLNYVDHARLSAELFNLMPLPDLSAEEKAIISTAVRYHSKGLVGLNIKQAKNLAEDTLGLLVVVDHCGDAASPSGVARAIQALGDKPTVSDKFGYARFKEILDGKESVISVEEAGRYKSESVIAHLVYNYQASWSILETVRHLLSDRYWNEVIIPRQEMYKTIILALMEFQH